MSKIIDLVPLLKTVNQGHQGFEIKIQNGDGSNDKILDFASEKKKIIFQERRQVRRNILSEFMSAMVVLPEKGLLKVNMYDISEEGVSFELEAEVGQFKVGEEISMRVYLNQKNYFPIQISIKHTTADEVSGLVRHGSEFIKSMDSDVALRHFVQFIESASDGLRQDVGDLMVARST